MRHTITAESTDPSKYYKIDLSSPIVYANQQVQFCVTTFTTNCNILVLTTDDYLKIEIEGNNWKKTKIIKFLDNYTTLESETFTLLFNDLIIDQFSSETDEQLKLEKFTVELTTPELLRINHECSDTKTKFRITEMSYNLKLLCGAYGMKFPIEPELSNEQTEMLTFSSTGFYLSTPIWYIIGRTGTMNFSNEGSGNVVMKIPNNFVSKFPIVYANMDFITMCNSTDLTNMTFELTDSNYVPIKILNPVYLSINVEPFDSMADLLNAFNPNSGNNISPENSQLSNVPQNSQS